MKKEITSTQPLSWARTHTQITNESFIARRNSHSISACVVNIISFFRVFFPSSSVCYSSFSSCVMCACVCVFWYYFIRREKKTHQLKYCVCEITHTKILYTQYSQRRWRWRWWWWWFVYSLFTLNDEFLIKIRNLLYKFVYLFICLFVDVKRTGVPIKTDRWLAQKVIHTHSHTGTHKRNAQFWQLHCVNAKRSRKMLSVRTRRCRCRRCFVYECVTHIEGSVVVYLIRTRTQTYISTVVYDCLAFAYILI